jgi:serine O-acetyltransferase
MLRRLESLFGSDASERGDGLLALIVSDYVAYYGPSTRMRKRWGVGGRGIGGGWRDESPRRLALMFLPRLLHNPSLHATLLIRLASHSPRFMLGFWRTVLIAKHSIDISHNMQIGPGLVLPHPVGIALGASVRIGSNATIFHYVGVGGNVFGTGGYRAWEPGAQLCPVIGDDVVIFMDSTLVGRITVGDRAVIGAGAWVERDLPPGTIQPGRAALFRRLAAAEDASARP